MNEREQIINFLLQNLDQKNLIIEAQQKKIAELEKAQGLKVEVKESKSKKES